MQRPRLWIGGMALGALAAVALAACGDSTRLPEAPPTGPLAASPVPLRETGNAKATVDQSSVTYSLDASGTLVVRLRITSTAPRPQTIAVRASLLDANGMAVGDATGGDINIAGGATVPLQLTGPAPNGTIASAVFEVSTMAAPTPTAATPGGAIGTPAV